MIMIVRLFLFIFIIIGCSEKQYFSPPKESIIGDVMIDGKLDSEISQSNRNGARLSNGSVITKDGIYEINLKENFIFLNTKDNLFLASNYDDNKLYIFNSDGKELQSFSFPSMPLGATLKDNILAIVLSDNSTILWDIKTNEELFNVKHSNVYTIDSRVSSPAFIKDNVIFPTLDGKLIFVNLKSLKITNNIAIGANNIFNNIIYLAFEGDNIIAATKNKLVTIIDGKDFNINLNVVDILYAKNKIYVLSLEGEIIEFNLLLKELNKRKFPFASLSGIIISDSIYTLESQGYLIKIDPNTFIDSIYKIDISKYKNNFYTDDVIYYDNQVIKFPREENASM